MRFWTDSSYNVWRWLGLTGLVVSIFGAAADLRAETADTESAPASFAELLEDVAKLGVIELEYDDKRGNYIVRSKRR